MIFSRYSMRLLRPSPTSHAFGSWRFPLAARSVLAVALAALPLSAQSVEPPIHLVVNAGRSLRIAIDRRIAVKQTGQQIDGILVEPVYAYDRVVLPAGTKAIGHIAAIENLARSVRVRSIMGGDFTPPKRVTLQFDKLALGDGRTIPVQTSATEGAENVVLCEAPAERGKSIASKARAEIAREAKQSLSLVTAPDKTERFKVAAIRALPYHPRLLTKGTVYTARLSAPIEFGSGAPVPRAPAGATPAPESVLLAQLVTPIGSAISTAGTRIEAVLTQPVFAADGNLILPEGTTLTGEVTVAKPARHFHHHGQLRFLFESVRAPDREPTPLLASLHAVESSQNDRVTIDEEGGATSSSSKARFAAPALAALALIGATHGRPEYDSDGAGPETQYGGAASGGLGGFVGLGMFGIGLNQLGPYVTIATTAFGLAQTLYSTVFAKGREITFPQDTSIQVQLAPGPGSTNDKQEQRK